MKKLFAQFMKFGVVGLINTAVDFIFFYAANFLWGNIFFAQTLGFCAGVANSFIWNRSWTFKSDKPFKFIDLLKFITVNVVALLVSLMIFWRLEHLNENLVKLFIVTPVVMTINFSGSRFWVFRHK